MATNNTTTQSDEPLNREQSRHPDSFGAQVQERGQLLYSLDQAAALLACSRVTLYREHTRGAIAFVKLRGRTAVTAGELARYIASLEEAA